jgi:hypothetical protein
MLPPLNTLIETLHLGHLSEATAAGLALSMTAQRQIRHLSYEFVQLHAEQFGPQSDRAGTREWIMATQNLMEFFDEAARRGTEEPRIIETVKLAQTTLREIRTLRGGDHFFSKTLDAFFTALTFLGVDYDQFASALIWELHKYREQRDREQARFLEPYYRYSAQLLEMIGEARSGQTFDHFEILKPRIKGDVLAKLVMRGWKDMNEFYDLVGIRILVGCQREVGPAVTLVEKALRVYEESAITNPEAEHYFRIDHIERKLSVEAIDRIRHQDVKTGFMRLEYNDRGYQAEHVNVRRYSRIDGRDHPTGELQVTSRGLGGVDCWGEHQRRLVPKDDWNHGKESQLPEVQDPLPESVKLVVNAYCRSVSGYVVAYENGETTGPLPDLGDDIMVLNHIPKDVQRSEYFDSVCEMDAWMRKYCKVPPSSNGSNGRV